MGQVKSPRAWRRVIVAAVALAVASVVATRRRGRTDLEGRTLVRCRSSHLFRTTWGPGPSLASMRRGRGRVQYCPVGRHWTLVSVVKDEGVLDHHVRRSVVPRDLAAP